MQWLLNYTAEGLPAISSIPYLFWNAQGGVTYHDWSIVAYQSLKSLIAFPIWEFSRNNFGDPRLEPLPEEFNISASLCRPYYKIILDSRAFVAYLVLESVVLMFCWAVIVWRLLGRVVIGKLSSFPMVDFAAKLVEKGISGEHHSICDLGNGVLWDAGNRLVLRTLKDVKVIRRTQSEEISLREVSLSEANGVARPPGVAGEGTVVIEAGDRADLASADDSGDGLQGAVSGEAREGEEREEREEREEHEEREEREERGDSSAQTPT